MLFVEPKTKAYKMVVKFENDEMTTLELNLSMDLDDEFGFSDIINEKQKKAKKSGGFQSMGLLPLVLRGVLRKGYKVPTPIQRKTVPMILEGKDVVAMARTGSGKTAAFLIPLFQRLKTRSAKAGARALIFSPTRELAQQTMKFTKELGRFTGLRAAIVLGGDKLESQFEAIHESPDILIATPGRFLHVVIEMDLKLSSIEYVVFDEADRLFEMGFQDQLQEIIHRLPDNRQTLLFSATLPKLLVDFAKAGLSNPVLVRLDIESKLSDKLKTAYLYCRPDEKLSLLLYLLNTVIDKKELTVIFMATKHHVEYAKMVLEQANISCSYVYSSLDAAARKIQVAKFQARKSNTLIVTDVAARGIDIPLLDNVINYNFPAKPKLFVHRVGRVARAGRSGTAYSIISHDEFPYVLDLHLFMGESMKLAAPSTLISTNGVFGNIPQTVIEEESDELKNWHESSIDLKNMAKVCANAYKQYLKSRPICSLESAKRVKKLLSKPIGIHPLFRETQISAIEEKNKFLENMKNYRPKNTIFEIGNTAKNQQASVIMRTKKDYHRKAIERAKTVKGQDNFEEKELINSFKLDLPLVEEDDLQAAFPNLSKCKNEKSKNVNRRNYRDEENFLHYQSATHHVEKGLEIDKSFDRQAAREVMDLTGDDESLIKERKNVTQWDRKKKKFVNKNSMEPNSKKIRTESGALIPATYKSNAYKQWKEKSKIESQEQDSENEIDRTKFRPKKGKWKGTGKKVNGRPFKRELKTKDEILKTRKKHGKMQSQQFKSKMKKKTKLKRGL